MALSQLQSHLCPSVSPRCHFPSRASPAWPERHRLSLGGTTLHSRPWPPPSSAWIPEQGTAPASQSFLCAKEKRLLQGQDMELNENSSCSIRNSPSVHPSISKDTVPVI